MLSIELRHRGCRIVTAADGREAVEKALAVRPDLILVDLNMPGLDGLAATERLRAHGELDRVTIIAVTAFDTYGIREAALEAGAPERALRVAMPGYDLNDGEASS